MRKGNGKSPLGWAGRGGTHPRASAGFATNEGFGAGARPKAAVYFLPFHIYSILAGFLQIYKPKERAGGEKREKIGQKGGEGKQNGAEVLAVIIIRISVFEYRGKKSGRLV